MGGLGMVRQGRSGHAGSGDSARLMCRGLVLASVLATATACLVRVDEAAVSSNPMWL